MQKTTLGPILHWQMIKALLRFYFFKFLIFFSIVFLHLWLQSTLECQVLRRPVDPCYTADDRSYDNRQGNRACYSDYDVNHYVVVVVICRTKTKNNNTAKRHNLIFKINKKLSYRRGTAQHAVTVKTVLNVAQMFVELHLMSPTLGKWPSRSSKFIGNGTNR